jgi:hypothetical protein
MRWFARALLLSILAAAVATNLPAQRGAGRGVSGPLPSSTAIGAGALRFGPSTTARSTQAARGFVTRRGPVVSSRGFFGRNSRRLPYAYWLTPYYFPFDYSYNGYAPYGDGPDYDSGYDPNEQAAMTAQNALVDEVRRLSFQVSQLQNGQQTQGPVDTSQQEPQPPQVPITLVLRDGQQLQVQNYAVMNQTFWDFSKQPGRKIPIANIDVAASERATEAKGGEFPQLATQ